MTLAHWESDKLNIWTSSMGTFIKRAKLAKTLDLPYSSCGSTRPTWGAPSAARSTCIPTNTAPPGCPCNRPPGAHRRQPRGDFSAYRHAQPLIVEVKTGVKKDGTIVAQQLRVINNAAPTRVAAW